MSSTPIPPAGSAPPVPPYWRDDDDWIVLIEFLRRDDDEDRARGAEAIGYMLACTQMTDTRMLAFIGDPDVDANGLLFSFSSPENKAIFFGLLQSNEATTRERFEILVPHPDEIAAAQPIARVLPVEVMRQVIITAAMLLDGGSGVDP